MTEAAWLACEDPKLLLRALLGRADDRKLRLCACAIARREPGYVRDELRQRGIELAERIADGLATEEEWEATHEELQLRKEEEVMAREFDRARITRNAQNCLHRNQRYFFWVEPKHRTLSSTVVPVIRDIFGNPFRTVTFLPEWHTSTVVALVAEMYESRDFSPMPILGDALQDAGCEDEVILSHCRGTGPHVRGCWVTDTLRNKS